MIVASMPRSATAPLLPTSAGDWIRERPLVLLFLHAPEKHRRHRGHCVRINFLGAGRQKMVACFQTLNHLTEADEGELMRFAYVVLIALPFLSGCASRPVVQNQQSASAPPVYQANASPPVES